VFHNERQTLRERKRQRVIDKGEDTEGEETEGKRQGVKDRG
jgi:hypothetical protein